MSFDTLQVVFRMSACFNRSTFDVLVGQLARDNENEGTRSIVMETICLMGSDVVSVVVVHY